MRDPASWRWLWRRGEFTQPRDHLFLPILYLAGTAGRPRAPLAFGCIFCPVVIRPTTCARARPSVVTLQGNQGQPTLLQSNMISSQWTLKTLNHVRSVRVGYEKSDVNLTRHDAMSIGHQSHEAANGLSALETAMSTTVTGQLTKCFSP